MAQHLVQVFNNPIFGSIRTLNVDGKVYFCGNDIAAALGYARPRKAVDTHCKGAPKWCPLQTPGGTQQVRFITEGDVYRLIMESRLPAAERFEAWVVDEVLPSIRTQGAYITAQAMRDPAFIARLLETIQEEQARRLSAEQALAEITPKAIYFDIVMNSKDALPIRVIAKDFGLSAQRLNQILHEAGVQYKQSGTWLLYQAHTGKGYTDTKTHIITEDGRTRVHTYWTQKGRLFIYDLLKGLGILPVIEREENAGDHNE